MCIKCQLHILRVLNVCLAGFGLSSFVQHQDWHHFFPSSLLGFRALKYLSDVPAKFIIICGGKMCSKHGTGGNFTIHGTFQSPHIKILAQMQPGSMFYYLFKLIVGYQQLGNRYIISNFGINSNPLQLCQSHLNTSTEILSVQISNPNA